jgi:hypothetical protein
VIVAEFVARVTCPSSKLVVLQKIANHHVDRYVIQLYESIYDLPDVFPSEQFASVRHNQPSNQMQNIESRPMFINALPKTS